MTLAGSIKTCLYDNWSLTGNVARGKIKFSDIGWYDATDFKPQIVVTPTQDLIHHYFGGTLRYSYQNFLVNIWVHVPAGAKGDTEETQAEAMRYEVSKIIQANKTAITPFGNIVPLDNGRPLHEVEGVRVRIIRWEVTLQGALSKTNT